jgi:hypothetical protein
MDYEIEVLTPAVIPGQKFSVIYQTKGYYDLVESSQNDMHQFSLKKCWYDHPIVKSFDIELAPDYYENAIDYAISDQGLIIALLEIAHEHWNNRLRVTELWVHEDHRHEGIGKKLLDFAEEKGKEFGARAMVLETQSCNLPAIGLYLNRGFEWIGFDKTAYSNEDVAKQEIRLEMGKKI